MKPVILKESELNKRLIEIYKEEEIKIIQEKWDKLSGSDRTFVLEFLKEIYPEKSYLIKESKWYNTVGDIAGIFDPTGIIDVVNGISYWRQGDKLFALLSFVSAVPYVGDLIGKPVVGVMKAGGMATKAFKAATLTGDAAKVASSAKAAGGPIAKMVETAPSWGGKLVEFLKGLIGRVPFLGKKLIRLIEEYVSLFTSASKASKTSKVVGTASKDAEAVFRGFRDFKGVKNNWFKYMKSDVPLWEKLNAGSFRIFGGNPATRSLMRRSKWYLGLLDAVGVANTTGPEEVESKVNDFDTKLDEYNRSPEGKRNYQEDMSQQSSETTPPPPPKETESSGGGKDPFSMLMSLITPQNIIKAAI